MPTTLEDLDRRVTKLEHAQNDSTVTLKWMAGTLGKIQAVQDHHTEELATLKSDMVEVKSRLGGVEHRMDKVETRLERLEAKVDALPRVLAEMLDERDKQKKK